MNEFLAISLGFPTVIYSVVLLIVIGLWLISALGFLGMDALDFGLDDGGAGGEVGIFARLGLDGVPWLLVLTLVVLFGWVITYFLHLFLLSPLPGALRYGIGIVVALLALVPSILLTAAVLRPLRKFLLRLQAPPLEALLGKVATVRTPTVDGHQGLADLDNGGAGLILQVRSPDEILARGDRVVLIEHIEERNTWRVVRESDYAAL